MIYGTGTQLQVAPTQNVLRVDDLSFTTFHLRIAILHMFFSTTFFPVEEFFKNSFNSKKMIISSKLCRKKIGHRVRLGENDLLFLWQVLSHRETAMLLMCARYERTG